MRPPSPTTAADASVAAEQQAELDRQQDDVEMRSDQNFFVSFVNV